MKKLKFVSVFALVALLLSVSPGAVLADEPLPRDRSIVSSYVETQTNPNLTDEEKIKDAIDSYFKLRYESQRQLKPLDFSFLTADSSQTQDWAREEKDKREIELYNAKLYKLNYVEYDYSLDYESVEVKDGRATVRLRESHTVVFEAIAPQVSAMGGLEHVITLRKTREGWVIVRDEYQDELTQLVASETKEQIIERIQLNREAELQQAANFDASQNTDRSMTARGIHAYRRWPAVSYANRWGKWPGAAGDRNPAYIDYDCCGGDCTNYASQVIYEGTLHHDSPLWYPYHDNWIYPGGLGDFLKNNNESGPHASKVTNPCNLRQGDVIQLWSNSGKYWFHSLVVVSNHVSNCWRYGPGAAILYNAHYTDRHRYTFSHVSGYQKRYIHITGWKD